MDSATGRSRRRRAGRMRRAALALGLSGLLGCSFLESYGPQMVALGGTIAQVAALTLGGGQYASQVSMLTNTLMPIAQGMTVDWAEQRRRERELAELAALESEMESEYAALEEGYPVAQSWGSANAPAWGSANGPPPAGDAPPPAPAGDTWGSAAPRPTFQDAPAEPPAPSENPWGERYARARELPPGVMTRSSEPIALDTALLRRVVVDGEEQAVAFEDSETLFNSHDGQREADRFRVFFSPNQDAYVYVVAVDSIARVQPIFPRELPPRGPIAADAEVFLPSPDGWYGLDQYTGLQHIYFYVSEKRHHKLEALLYGFASKPPPEPTEGTIYTVREPTIIENNAVRGRGLTGLAPPRLVEVETGEGRSQEILTSSATTGTPGEDLVITRVFWNR